MIKNGIGIFIHQPYFDKVNIVTPLPSKSEAY